MRLIVDVNLRCITKRRAESLCERLQQFLLGIRTAWSFLIPAPWSAVALGGHPAWRASPRVRRGRLSLRRSSLDCQVGFTFGVPNRPILGHPPEGIAVSPSGWMRQTEPPYDGGLCSGAAANVQLYRQRTHRSESRRNTGWWHQISLATASPPSRERLFAGAFAVWLRDLLDELGITRVRHQPVAFPL